MEDSDSKHNESMSFAHNEEMKLIKDVQALMSSSIPTDLFLSILQSQMLSHSNNDAHQSISHLLISYSGKRGTIANITILPLDIAQVNMTTAHISFSDITTACRQFDICLVALLPLSIVQMTQI